MSEQQSSVWESLKTESANVVDRLREIIREGNVRRVIVRQGSRTVAEFPLTVGVVGAVLAPILAAIGAIVALLKDCTIHVERDPSAPVRSSPEEPADDLDLI